MNKKTLVILAFVLSSFLWPAAYATTDMVGDTSGTNNGEQNTLHASNFTASGSGTLLSLGLNLQTGGGNLIIGLYDDNGAGAPNHLICTTDSQTANTGWNDYACNGTVNIVLGTVYWLVHNVNNVSAVEYYKVGTADSYYIGTAYGALPPTFPSGSAAYQQRNARANYNTTNAIAFSQNTSSLSDSRGAGNFSINWNNQTNKFGQGMIQIDSTNYTMSVISQTATNTILTYNITNLLPGSHYYLMYGNDTGGIGNKTGNVSFTINNSITLTIGSPLNTTYLRANVTLNFTVTGDSSTYNCTRQVVGNGTTDIGNTTNNTYYTESINSLEPTGYNMTVSCSGNTGVTGSNSTVFTIIHWNVTRNQSTSPIYETNNTIFNFSLDVMPSVSYVNASLVWNGTTYPNSTIQISGSEHRFSRNQSVSLLVTNNTGVSWYWSFNVSYANGTNVNNRTTAEGNQSIIFAYSFNYYNISHMTGAFEGELFKVNSTFNRLSGGNASILSNMTFNATNITNSSFSSSALNSFFGYSVNAPLITETSTNATYNLTFLVTYGASSRVIYSNTSNLNITRIYLGNCTSGSQTTKVMSFVGKDEEGFGNLTVNYSLSATFWVWNNSAMVRNYSFGYTNQTAYDLCISPSNTVVYVNSSMEYSAANFPARTYYIVNGKITGTSDNSSVNVINHYLLNDSLASIVTFTIKDSTGSPISNLYVKLKRFSTSTNSYATVQISKSDFEGKAIVKARLNDAFYQLIVDDGVKVLTSKDAFQIKSSSIPLTIDPKSPLEYFQYYKKISYACAYDNATLTLQCTLSDSSNLMNKACLYLYQIGTLSDTLVTKTCSTDPNPTVGYTWASWSDIQGKTFRYQLYAELSTEINNEVYLLSRFLELSASVSPFGATGMLLASMVVFTSAMMGVWSPPVAIALGVSSLTVLSIANLISIPLAGLASIIFVGLVFIWRVVKR